MIGATGETNPYCVNEKMNNPAGKSHANDMAPMRRYSGTGIPLFSSRLRSYTLSDHREVPKPMKQPRTRAMYGRPEMPSLQPWFPWKQRGIAERKRKVIPQASEWEDRGQSSLA